MINSRLSRQIRRLPAGFLGMLALVVLVDGIWLARSRDFVALWSEDWRLSAQVASSGLHDRDLLLFGDSLIKYGVLPRQIEARTGLKGYNLALHAGTVPSSYFMLRRALEAGAKPRLIMVDFFALMRPDDPHWRIAAYSNLATVRDALDIAATAHDSNLASEMLLGKLLTSYKSRWDIRDSVMAAFNGKRFSVWPAQEIIWKTWADQNGAQPTPFMPWRFVYDPVLHGTLVFNQWECDPLQVAYIDKFLALAESKQIPVVWLLPPLSPQVHAVRHHFGNDAAYDQLARSMLMRHPNVEVLDARNSGYDDSVHVDLLHLEVHGARVYSNDLADHLAERLLNQRPPSADRWATMPPLAGRTGDEPARVVAQAPKRRTTR